MVIVQPELGTAGLSSFGFLHVFNCCVKQSDSVHLKGLQGGVFFLAFPKPKSQKQKWKEWMKQSSDCSDIRCNH